MNQATHSIFNRVLNINGFTDEQLMAAVKMAFSQAGLEHATRWTTTAEHGLVFLGKKDETKGIEFPCRMTPEACVATALLWLKSPAAKEVKLEGFDAYCDSAGPNIMGWRVFTNDWGGVGTLKNGIFAVKPAWIWTGF